MAGYSAVIDVRVQGQDDLRALTDGVGRLNDLIRKVKPVPTLFDKRGTDEVKKLKTDLAGLLKAYADGNTSVAKFSTSIAGAAQQLASFRAIAANAKVGTDEFSNALKAAARASTNVLEKELERFSELQQIYQRQPKGGLSVQDQGPSMLVRDLINLKNTVPNSVSALERYQRELLDVQHTVSMTSIEYRELAEVIRQVDVALGRGGQFGPAEPPMQGPEPPANFRPGLPAARPAGGIQGLMARPGVADALIGGAFPLLFGGGPGATVGGFAGGLAGGAMGGMAGMALSLALSAVGQQIDAAVKQIRDMQLALDGLNIDKLRESFVFVNAALDTTVRRLIEAGKYDQARAAIAAEVALQTGASTEATKDSAAAAIGLSTSWSKLVGSLSATTGILGGPLAAALALIIEGVNLVVVGLNTVLSLIGGGIKRGVEAILRLLPGGEQLIKNLEVAVRGVTEEEAKLAAEITEITDKQQRQIEYNQKLLGLEKQRTLGRTTEEKQINALIDSQIAREQIKQEYAAKALDLRRKAAAATTTEAQQAANTALLQNEALQAQALKQQDIKDLLVQQGLELENNAQKYADAAVAINQQIDALERADAVRQSSFQAEAALNDLYGAQLDRQYRLATTAQERYDIAIAQFYQQVKAAELEYEQTLASNEILKQKAALQAQLVKLKYQELVAEKEIAIAQAGARGNTPEQISDLSDAYDKSIQAQAKAVGIATAQVKATDRIVENQNAVAKAILQTKLLKTEEALAQKLVTAEIGLSEQQANLLATRLRESVQQTVLAQGEGTKLVGVIEVGASKASIFANAMTQVAVAADTAAYNIRRAFIEQQNLNAARGAQPAAAPAAVTGAADGAYWPGGFKAFADGGVVSRPTLGLIGEGGEPEYVIPSSKMNAAMARYASGKRGESVIPQTAGSDTAGGGDYAPNINPMINVTTGPVMNMNGSNYVSQRDFVAGMQAASRRGAEMALMAMRNSGTVRRVVGAR